MANVVVAPGPASGLPTVARIGHVLRTTARQPRPVLRWPAHLVTMLLGTWLMVGLFVDGWAHINLAALETFFTPWHALFYSGFLATAGWMFWLVLRQALGGRRGLAAIPRGYELGIAGVLLFGLGGAGDMLWHIIFGIEADIEALFSPTHLLLLAGMTLILSSPFRSAWASSDPAEDAPPLVTFLPALLSATLVTALFSFFLMYLSAFRSVELWQGRAGELTRLAAPGYGLREMQYLSQRSGVGSILVSNLLLMAPLLLMLRRWRLPFGSVAIMFGLTTALVTALGGMERFSPYIVVALVSGLIGDGLLRVLRAPPQNVGAFRTVATALPLVLWSLYVLTIQYVQGLGWGLELSSGVVVLASLSGLMLSVVMVPPAVPARAGPV